MALGSVLSNITWSLRKTLTPETNFIVFTNGDVRLLNWMMSKMAAF